MGFYINPENCSKEEWLARYGSRLLSQCEAAVLFESEEYLPVCLVNNVIFTAAGIAYSKEELDAFCLPDDKRQKIFFKVSKKYLFKVCPELKNYMK